MVQITTTQQELKEFMLAKSNQVTLITGLHGSGKNYLCSVLVNDRLTSLDDSELYSSEKLELVVDLDRLSRHEKALDGRDRWVADVNAISVRAGIIIVGTCDNYDEVLAKVEMFRQSTGTPVVILYSMPSFQVFSQANMAKAKQAREENNPFLDRFERAADLNREGVSGQINRKLGLLGLAITTVFAPQMFSGLYSIDEADGGFAVLARKVFGPLDRYESLYRMLAWLNQLATISKLSIVIHLNEKADDQVITKGWHEDEVVWKHEVVPVLSPAKAESQTSLELRGKGGKNDNA